jgi:hypothetical protein
VGKTVTSFAPKHRLTWVRMKFIVVYSELNHVKWVPCHHGMTRPPVADGGDGLLIWCRHSFPTAMPRRMHTLSKSRGAGRSKAGASDRRRGRRRLGSRGSKEGAAGRPRYRAHSTGSRDRTTPEMERHRRPQPNGYPSR